MTEIVMRSRSHHNLPCSPSSIPTDYYNDGLLHQTGQHCNHQEYNSLFNTPHNSYSVSVCCGDQNTVLVDYQQENCTRGRKRREREAEAGDQVSLLAVFVTVFRKSLVACRSAESFEQEMSSLEIGLPTNVRHVAHVTFDRFNGFLGLPVEFEPEVPRRPPSASTSVFGVSTEAMQLSFDSRGNSVPTVLLMMQRRLYSQGGLQAEGIFRINGDNGQEEHMREQLNRGEIPENIDVHCLAGLIKAWFRELPNGVLDSLEPEQVMQARSEEECSRLVKLLPPTEASLMDWAINLMADVAQLEHLNKMNARNVAMVFAPNMTQMADPLTALMYAVQVMNFLKTLIVKTLREREDSIVDPGPASHSGPFDESGQEGSSHQITKEEVHEREEDDLAFLGKEPLLESATDHRHHDDQRTHGLLSSIENFVQAQAGKRHLVDNCPGELPTKSESLRHGQEDGNGGAEVNSRKARSSPSNNSCFKKNPRKASEIRMAREAGTMEKSRGSTIVSRLHHSRTERVEAWR